MSQYTEDSTLDTSTYDSEDFSSRHSHASSSTLPFFSSSFPLNQESDFHSNDKSEFILSHSVSSEPISSYLTQTSHLSLFPSSNVTELPSPSHIMLKHVHDSKELDILLNPNIVNKEETTKENEEAKEEEMDADAEEAQSQLTVPSSPSFTQISFETYLFQTEPSLCSWTQLDIASSNSATPMSSRRTTREWTQSDTEDEWNLSSTFLPTYSPDTTLDLPSLASTDLPTSTSSWASWGLSKLVYFLESMSIPDLESNYLSSSFTQESSMPSGHYHDTCCMKGQSEDFFTILHHDNTNNGESEEGYDLLKEREQGYLSTSTWVHCNSS